MKLILLLIFVLKTLSQRMTAVELNEVAGCVACRFIWENIQESLGANQRNAILAAEAFQYYCKISPDIFYQPCNAMFETLFEMSEDFKNGDKVDDICKKYQMCTDNNSGKTSRRSIQSQDMSSSPDEENYDQTKDQVSGEQLYNHYEQRKKFFEQMQKV